MLGYGWEFPPNMAVQGQSPYALVDRTGTRVYEINSLCGPK